MEDKGYQIPNLVELDQLIDANVPNETLVALILWLTNEINTEIKRDSLPIKCEVIKYEYRGTFPYIGILYDAWEVVEDYETYVQTKVKEKIYNLPFSSLYCYLIENKATIEIEMQKIK